MYHSQFFCDIIMHVKGILPYNLSSILTCKYSMSTDKRYLYLPEIHEYIVQVVALQVLMED